MPSTYILLFSQANANKIFAIIFTAKYQDDICYYFDIISLLLYVPATCKINLIRHLTCHHIVIEVADQPCCLTVYKHQVKLSQWPFNANYLAEYSLLLVGCITSQQHASVSQGQICSDNFTCCHTETEVSDPTFHLTQSQYTDTGLTSPNTDPIKPGAWQCSHWIASF